jgi:hypothetical protein
MPDEIITLVDRGSKLKSEIRLKQEELKEIDAKLIERGSGTYHGTNGTTCTVVVPNPGIKPSEDDVRLAMEVAGDHASKLFDKTVLYKPVKSFREVATALLTKAKAAKLINICLKASSPFVKWAQ